MTRSPLPELRPLAPLADLSDQLAVSVFNGLSFGALFPATARHGRYRLLGHLPLLALLRWHRPEARLLVALACMRLGLGHTHLHSMQLVRTGALLAVFYPALLFVLRRPNAGTVPRRLGTGRTRVPLTRVRLPPVKRPSLP